MKKLIKNTIYLFIYLFTQMSMCNAREWYNRWVDRESEREKDRGSGEDSLLSRSTLLLTSRQPACYTLYIRHRYVFKISPAFCITFFSPTTMTAKVRRQKLYTYCPVFKKKIIIIMITLRWRRVMFASAILRCDYLRLCVCYFSCWERFINNKKSNIMSHSLRCLFLCVRLRRKKSCW